MTLSNGATLLASPTFQGQVSVALLKLSNDIANESAGTANHAKRKQVSDAILYKQGTAEKISQLVARMVIATNTTIRDAVSPADGDVEYVVSGLLSDTTAVDAMLNL
jgi:hypothetical protein